MQKPASKKTPESNTTVDKAKLAPEKSAPTTMKKYYREGKSHIEAFSILLIIPHCYENYAACFPFLAE
jgi:hypothetical protein